ncbi:protein-tyrosine phosphatase-like protein [Epithele typhae]|uniref:protein-tyrosine phosphatase-like protein n=1 Tax=Epithele typhae TaxID=378194 RepID=UPI0020080CCE|nr:protein-tyrosine phosphatase-like protein [Epithele typhae]KAH9913996.1 protein-tyrosine phosphatase-like protein [Epithele typhae]
MTQHPSMLASPRPPPARTHPASAPVPPPRRLRSSSPRVIPETNALAIPSRKSRMPHPKRAMHVTREVSELIALGVTHVVSLIEERPRYPRGKLRTLHIAVEDVEDADILQHLDATSSFIKHALEDPKHVVLFEVFDLRLLLAGHCQMGISRSATAVCAYLISALSMSPQAALDFLVSKREIVSPNPGFRRQLAIYASRLRAGRKLRKAVPPPLLSPQPSTSSSHTDRSRPPSPVMRVYTPQPVNYGYGYGQPSGYFGHTRGRSHEFAHVIRIDASPSPPPSARRRAPPPVAVSVRVRRGSFS